jgi:hypothetical protein
MTGHGRLIRQTAASNRVVAAAALTIGVTIAHVLEDFVHGVPAQFGVEVAPAAAMLGVVYAAHVGLVTLAARGKGIGYLGNLAAGVAWLVASGVDHFGEVLFASPYREGLFSKAFIVGIWVSALALAIVSFAAWRSRP